MRRPMRRRPREAKAQDVLPKQFRGKSIYSFYKYLLYFWCVPGSAVWYSVLKFNI